MSINVLDSFKAIVDDAFRDALLNLRQDKASPIISEARASALLYCTFFHHKISQDT